MTRNRGMDAATGAFIAFVDPDDWIHPQYFELLLHLQKKKNCQVVFCGFSRPADVEEYPRYDLNKLQTTDLDLEGIYGEFDTKGYTWGRLYTQELVRERRFLPGVKTCEDAAFNALVFGNCPDIRACYVHLPLYYYYIRPDSLVQTFASDYELQLAKMLFACAQDLTDANAKRIILLEGLKRCATSRYELSRQRGQEDKVREGTLWLKRFVRALCAMDNVSWKDKLKYFALRLHPIAYQMYIAVKEGAA